MKGKNTRLSDSENNQLSEEPRIPPKPHSNPNSRSRPSKTGSVISSDEDDGLSETDRLKITNADIRAANSQKVTKADIAEVKTSLKGHFDAIQSLQNALSSTAATPTVFPARPVPSNRAKEQSSQAIKDRIRMIESTLRDVGENVSISENNSDPNIRESAAPSSHHRPPTPSIYSHSQYDGTSRRAAPISKPARKAASKMAIAHPSVIDRLDKMEISMAKLANTIMEAQINKNRGIKTGDGTAEPSSMAKLISEVHKLRHDFKAQEIINLEIMKKNDYLENQIKLMADPAVMILKTGQVDPRVENYCKKLISNLKLEIFNSLQSKVDTPVLEELVLHIATKEDLKSYVKKEKLGKILSQYQSERLLPGTKIANQNKNEFVKYESQTQETIFSLVKAIEKLEDKFSDASKSNHEYAEKIVGNLQQSIDFRLQNLVLEKPTDRKAEMEGFLHTKLEKLKQDIDKGVKEMISNSMQHIFDENTYFPNNQEETNPLLKKLVRDFDEKIYTICSDLSACKQLFVSQSSQPFYRCAQWMWTSGHLKLGSAVPWNLQTSNTGVSILIIDPDNFRWTEDHFNIKIADAGLYEINFAFFTKSKPSIQIVVNGESVLSAINSPSYVVQHSSGFVTDGHGKVEQGTITGISLVVYQLLITGFFSTAIEIYVINSLSWREKELSYPRILRVKALVIYFDRFD